MKSEVVFCCDVCGKTGFNHNISHHNNNAKPRRTTGRFSVTRAFLFTVLCARPLLLFCLSVPSPSLVYGINIEIEEEDTDYVVLVAKGCLQWALRETGVLL